VIPAALPHAGLLFVQCVAHLPNQQGTPRSHRWPWFPATDVLFGDKTHFRREPIWFKVVDLDSPYHALLGRPALAKFMAIPHYAYLKMKMSGPKGIITIAGDYKKLLTCAAASSQRWPREAPL
jgi:hypothetical protein